MEANRFLAADEYPIAAVAVQKELRGRATERLGIHRAVGGIEDGWVSAAGEHYVIVQDITGADGRRSIEGYIETSEGAGQGIVGLSWRERSDGECSGNWRLFHGRITTVRIDWPANGEWQDG